MEIYVGNLTINIYGNITFTADTHCRYIIHKYCNGNGSGDEDM